jgi:hypothetical protein
MNDWTYWANIAHDEENARNNALRDRESEAEQRLTQGRARVNTNFDANFTPDFYNQYAKALMDYWQPDMDRQYGDAQRSLNYTFAEGQPGGGSAPAEAFGRLKEAYDRSLLTAQDNSKAQANQLRGTNEGQRSALLAQLDQGTDPSSVVATSNNVIGNIPRPPTYSPIGDLFSNLTQQFATAQQAYRNNYPGWGFGVSPTAPSYPSGGNNKSMTVIN